jgi:hypothetical protein
MKFKLLVVVFIISASTLSAFADSEKLSSMRDKKVYNQNIRKIYLCLAFGLPGKGFDARSGDTGATGFEFPYFIAAPTAHEAVLESDSRLRDYIIRNRSTLSNMIASNEYEVDCRQSRGTDLASMLEHRSSAYAQSLIDKNESSCRVIVVPTSNRKASVDVISLFIGNKVSNLYNEDQTELYRDGATGKAYPTIAQSLPSSAITGHPVLNNSKIEINGLNQNMFHVSSISIQWQTLTAAKNNEEFREAIGSKVTFGTTETQTAGVFLSSECINQ